MEGPRDVKRLKREYAKVSFETFKVNAFIDYMMQANEEQKDFWATYFTKQNVHKTGWLWYWIEPDQLIALHNAEARFCHIASRITFDYDPTRYQNLSRKIVCEPWLLTEHSDLYQKANATFWVLIAKQLHEVDDVKSLSLVSKLLHQVMRKNVVYETWIDNMFRKNRYYHHYCNPCPIDMPLWKQFLLLSGQGPVLFYEQNIKSDAKWFFFMIVSKGGHGYIPVPKGCVFDEEDFKIYDASVKKRCLYERVDAEHYVSHDSSYYRQSVPIFYPELCFIFEQNMELDGMK